MEKRFTFLEKGVKVTRYHLPHSTGSMFGPLMIPQRVGYISKLEILDYVNIVYCTNKNFISSNATLVGQIFTPAPF